MQVPVWKLTSRKLVWNELVQKKEEVLVRKVDWNQKPSMLVGKIMIIRRIPLFMSGR